MVRWRARPSSPGRTPSFRLATSREGLPECVVFVSPSGPHDRTPRACPLRTPEEPFELTKRFVDLAPGAFPVFSLLSAFGRAAQLNVGLQREGRVLPFPFHFLDASQSMNVVPKNYGWHEFYSKLVDVERYTYSAPRIGRRFLANEGMIPKAMNLVRGISSERLDRVRHHAQIRDLLGSNPDVQRFHHGDTTKLPSPYGDRIRTDLGALLEALPEGGLLHDHSAYLRSEATSMA